MEFYDPNSIDALAEERFNSQRDGILPHCLERYERWKAVSIPNGMEFYQAFGNNCKNFKSFNSQRNGILPISKPSKVRYFLFQFPTGWNSTDGIDQFISNVKGFQFPTGWNSTSNSLLTSVRVEKVSIPNGMEFYFQMLREEKDQRKFQFPTGWNSTQAPFLKFAPKRHSFNSQRDGILRERSSP